MKNLLKMRRKIKRRMPKFTRTEAFRQPTLSPAWRRPRGRRSRLRRREKKRGKLPSPGYRSPRAVRGLDRRGLVRVWVANPKELEAVDAKKNIAIIKSSVGSLKRQEIYKAADEKGIKIWNRRLVRV